MLLKVQLRLKNKEPKIFNEELQIIIETVINIFILTIVIEYPAVRGK